MGTVLVEATPQEICLFLLRGYQNANKFEEIDDLDELWDRLMIGERNRDVMISISTGSLQDADDLGLVKDHAYAVLGKSLLTKYL